MVVLGEKYVVLSEVREVYVGHGRSIWSNKSVASIIGPFVAFEDGSYCHAQTGEAFNCGEGIIRVGVAPEGIMRNIGYEVGLCAVM